MKPFIKDETVLGLHRDKSVFSRVYLDEYKAVSWDKDPYGTTKSISVDALAIWTVCRYESNTCDSPNGGQIILF